MEVAGEVIGSIGPGLCVLVGCTHDDTPEVARALADKVLDLRILDDEQGRMNVGLIDRLQAGHLAEVLVVSQFTLYANTARGRRPSWSAAAPGQVAEPLVDAVVERLRSRGAVVATGRFRAEMAVHLVNDGPVTIMVEKP